MIFQKEFMLVKQVCQKNAIFLAIGILKILVLSMNHTSLVTSALDTYLCNGCHDLMQKAMSFNDVAVRINFWYMSKDDAINIMNGSNLVDKRGVL